MNLDSHSRTYKGKLIYLDFRIFYASNLAHFHSEETSFLSMLQERATDDQIRVIDKPIYQDMTSGEIVEMLAKLFPPINVSEKKNILYKAIALANYDLKNNLDQRISINKSFIQEIIKIYLELSSSLSHPRDVAGGLDILKLDINDKKLNALTRNYFAIRREKIESLLLLAQEKKELPPNIKINEMVWNLESLWQGSVMLWALIGNGSINKWLIQHFESFFEAI